MHEVQIEPMSLERLASVLSTVRQAVLAESAGRARSLLHGLTVWNVNSTASGGGVAEMLQALLAYTRGAGVQTRWLVLEGNQDFFTLTKRVHNLLHGSPGDGGPTGPAERVVYEQVLGDQLAELRAMVAPGDLVILHDPQTAGLAPGLRDHGVHLVWRCHVGRDTANEATDRAWSFLRPYLAPAESTIFSRRSYAPPWIDQDRLWVIPPSLDPFSTKNRPVPFPTCRRRCDASGS
jgi:trehalose synthase